MYPPPPVTKTRLLEAITHLTHKASINRNRLPRELTHAHSIKAWLMCKWPLNLYTVIHTWTQSLWFPDSDMSAQWYFSQPVEKWKWNQSTELAQWILASYPGRSLNKRPGYEGWADTLLQHDLPIYISWMPSCSPPPPVCISVDGSPLLSAGTPSISPVTVWAPQGLSPWRVVD